MIMAYTGWVIVTIGIVVMLLGIRAMMKFPNFYSKMHAASLVETAGIILVLIGLTLLQQEYVSVSKICIIIALILVAGPVTSYALSRAAMIYKKDILEK
jgi:multicomponent Na+:H+ antiporter subunit G